MREKAAGPFTLPKLPWDEGALAPVMSARTIGLHYGKHHKTYVDKLNEFSAGTPYADMKLEEVVKASKQKGDQKIFNNAAQAWNHTFFWNCLAAPGKQPEGELKTQIDKTFGSLEALLKKLQEEAVAFAKQLIAESCEISDAPPTSTRPLVHRVIGQSGEKR